MLFEQHGSDLCVCCVYIFINESIVWFCSSHSLMQSFSQLVFSISQRIRYFIELLLRPKRYHRRFVYWEGHSLLYCGPTPVPCFPLDLGGLGCRPNTVTSRHSRHLRPRVSRSKPRGGLETRSLKILSLLKTAVTI